MMHELKGQEFYDKLAEMREERRFLKSEKLRKELEIVKLMKSPRLEIKDCAGNEYLLKLHKFIDNKNGTISYCNSKNEWVYAGGITDSGFVSYIPENISSYVKHRLIPFVHDMASNADYLCDVTEEAKIYSEKLKKIGE